jgi:hypothetical protein
MPPMNAKNTGLLGAPTELGLGDALNQQVQDETEEQKRRRLLLQQMQQAVSPTGASQSLGLTGSYGTRR